MSSSPQEPSDAAEKPARDFVVFRRARVHSDAGADCSRNDGRLRREVMSERIEQGLDGVEPGFMGFLHGRPLQKVVIENEGEPS